MKKNTITTDEVVKRLSETFETFDETRQEKPKDKNKTQLREKDRPVRKYGENHPKVKKY